MKRAPLACPQCPDGVCRPAGAEYVRCSSCRWAGPSSATREHSAAAVDPAAIVVTNVTYSVASAADRARGLVGFVSCCFDHRFVVDGITVRRALDGRVVLSFPERRDRAGRAHPVLRPINSSVRIAIERAVLHALAELLEARDG
jgi:DNA-binding cell septation regulator SpoVG